VQSLQIAVSPILLTDHLGDENRHEMSLICVCKINIYLLLIIF